MDMDQTPKEQKAKVVERLIAAVPLAMMTFAYVVSNVAENLSPSKKDRDHKENSVLPAVRDLADLVFSGKRLSEPSSRAHSQPTVQVVLLTTALEWRAAATVMQVLRQSLNVEEFIARREELGAEGYCLLGAWVGGQVASIASYTISPHVTYRRELLIHDMATLPDAQGQGHASALLEALGTIARARGCGRIFVHTRHAQPLYARNGFSDYSTGMVKMTEKS